jgi:hypothetical protein
MSSNTKVEPVSGNINGLNKNYILPDTYTPGSVRLIWNGILYQASDERHGFTEVSPNKITTFIAPRTNDVLLALYDINAASSSTGEHADGVQDLVELSEITQANREDRQVRLVEDENAIYRFDLGAVTGGIIPDDVDDGRWFKVGEELTTVIGSPFHPWGLMP